MEARGDHTSASAANGSDKGPLQNYSREVRASLGNNAAAYAYSVMITASFGVLTSILGSSSVFDVFAFAFGAATGFTITEAIASRGFRVRMRGERPEVVVLGSAMSYPSVLLGVGVAAVLATVLKTGVAWPAGAFGATTAFILVGAVELLLGQRAQRLRGVEDVPE